MIDWIDEETGLVTAGLSAELDAGDPDELQLTGLEVLGVWALKTVLGIAARLVSGELWRRWKAARTRAQFAELRAEIDGDTTVLDAAAALEDPTLRHDLVESLVEQGLTVRQAQKVVDGALDRVRTRYAA